MKISAFWFRRDLRLFDNHGLYEAIKSGKKVLCFFIFDRNILNDLPDKKDARFHFFFQQVRQLKLQLNNIGSDLMIAYDYPDKAWVKWITQFDIEGNFFKSGL
jgi:deoxyribodipyrimidine photo-lyase